MPKRILLADDSITIQKVVELTFSDGDYEVVAVNNGAKAIQKLSEMRPDIILSDIIMPEKNGYEVCEYVKSHPEYRTIPVVLLTGTFEPFDPDRADKAGCDAVVTKPFESQSLIHKVEELIQQSNSSAAPTQPAPAGEASPWSDEPAAAAPTAPEESPFGASSPTTPDQPFAAPAESPFQTAPEQAFSGETRAFPRMSFEELQQVSTTAPTEPQQAFPAKPPAAPEPSPWDQPPPAKGGETRAFPVLSREELQKMASTNQFPATPAPAPPPAPEPPTESPFAAPPTGGETRAFPRVSFDELKKMAEEKAPAPPPPPAEPEPLSPWEQSPPVGGETRAFPQMSFEQLQKMAEERAPEPAPLPGPSPWDSEPPAFNAEADEPAPIPFEIPAAAPEMPQPSTEAAFVGGRMDEIPFDTGGAEESPLTSSATPGEESRAAAGGGSGELTEEQIDRIARRVVQLMSTDLIRSIAWEVIPDMAEMVVKERIRQLENE